MPVKLATTVDKISTIPNLSNSGLVREFYKYMKENDTSEQNNSLKVIIPFANYLGQDITFYDIKDKEQIVRFLNTKVKSKSCLHAPTCKQAKNLVCYILWTHRL